MTRIISGSIIPDQSKEGLALTTTQHGLRIGVLMALAAAWLGGLATRTEIFYADGLRYIDQAQRIEAGAWADGLVRAIDHPIYPLAIAATHGWIGDDSPESWQAAAQGAAILAGVLLVVPLYLVALELFGARAAWLGVALTYAVPLTNHVLADALSEGTFLLFWCWGLWSALRFLEKGSFGWLPLTIAFAGLAYWTRPEGLLLPSSLVASLAAMPILRSTRLNWPRWWAAVGFLVLGAAVVIGPYIAAKGGLATKPAIARVLGTAPTSAPDAVERQRLLDPNQSTTRTYALAVKGVFEAVRDAVTIPLLPLAALGLGLACWPFRDRARIWLFLAIMTGTASAALIRLHATGGYCSPRHAMVLSFLLIPASALGLQWLLDSVVIPGRWLGLGEGRFTAGPAVWALVLAGLGTYWAPALGKPINAGMGGYRSAGAWIAQKVPPGEHVVDVTGWALYYGRHPGYTFANLVAAAGDRDVRWVVVREAHLGGPWWYSRELRRLIGDRRPLKTYPEQAVTGRARVCIYDLKSPPVVAARGARAADRR
jgi:4-amino-4-deoxy-L-arabinose transferase-like glycosyltransferase